MRSVSCRSHIKRRRPTRTECPQRGAREAPRKEHLHHLLDQGFHGALIPSHSASLAPGESSKPAVSDLFSVAKKIAFYAAGYLVSTKAKSGWWSPAAAWYAVAAFREGRTRWNCTGNQS